MSNPSLENQSPQLCMQCDELTGLPPVELTGGYALRTYRPGDAQAWCDVISDAFGGARSPADFERQMRGHVAFRPERIFFVVHEGEPVATASAWTMPALAPQAGYLHMVGCRASHQGRGLGRVVSLAALHRIAQEGRRRALLHTDDFRLAAIKTYLKLGFAPLVVDENQRERWRRVFEHLGRAELAECFRASLEAPVHEWPKPHADRFDLSGFAERRIWNADRKHRGGATGGGDISALGDESLYKGSSLGDAGCDVQDVAAGDDRPLTLWYRCGATPLEAGAVVRFCVRGQSPLGERIQGNAPDGRGFLALHAPPDVRLSRQHLGFRIEQGTLREGDKVELRIGHGKGYRWTPLAHRLEFQVTIEPHPLEPQMRLPEPVVVGVRPRSAHALDVLVDATPRGRRIKATVTVRDECDNRVPLDGVGTLSAEGQQRELLFVSGLARTDLPAPRRATRVRAALPKLKGAYTSNPCVPGHDLHLFVGDLHAHDFLNEAEGPSDAVYRWAIEDKALDFISVPLQTHSYHDNLRWTLVKHANERFLDEGRFVTFLAFEWQHSHYGDKVVHFLNGDQPYLPVDDARYDCPAKLYEALRGSDALVVSHHPAYPLDRHVPGTDWSAAQTDVERLVEIWSMHGSSEGVDPQDRPLRDACPENSVTAALKRGVRVGLVGGSDTHSGRPGGAVKEPRPHYPGGLCAVWAESLSRRSIFEALVARRTVALTKSRIVLDFRVNGSPMGSELQAADQVDIRAGVWGQCDIARIEIMKDGGVWRHVDVGDDHCALSFQDETGGRPAFYHCRVTQSDGNLAVCSPVWVG